MSHSQQIAESPALVTALKEWADPVSYATPQEVRAAIGELNIVHPAFLTETFVGRVVRLAGVQVRRTNKGVLYLGIRPPAPAHD
jgi:hypothetical protein